MLESRNELFQGDPNLEPRHFRAETEMLADPEANMIIRRTVDPEAVGIFEEPCIPIC
jgi:hypothetical protein